MNMIISEYFGDDGSRHANVCRQDKEWVVMIYENKEYLKTILARNEYEADEIAEDWVL